MAEKGFVEDHSAAAESVIGGVDARSGADGVDEAAAREYGDLDHGGEIDRVEVAHDLIVFAEVVRVRGGVMPSQKKAAAVAEGGIAAEGRVDFRTESRKEDAEGSSLTAPEVSDAFPVHRGQGRNETAHAHGPRNGAVEEGVFTALNQSLGPVEADVQGLHVSFMEPLVFLIGVARVVVVRKNE